MSTFISSRHIYNQLTQALAGIYEPEEARSIAFLVLETKWGLSRTAILSEKAVPMPEPGVLEEWIQRLQKHEPVQYILSEASFYGRQWQVNASVLIPRPETEELVQWVLETLNEQKRTAVRILDIGTGSGCIAGTLACEWPAAEVWAIDISAEALAVAQANAHRWKAGVQFRQADVLSDASLQAAKLPGGWDVIVSNPPYITLTEQADMHSNVLQHEPHTALFVPDSDPLVFYRHIAALAQTQLAAHGWIFVEINEYLAEQTLQLFHSHGFNAFLKEDLFGKKRMIGGQFTARPYVC